MAVQNIQFHDVAREQCKASIVIEGLSGRGKSGLSLLIANALSTDPTQVFALDTEKKSLNLFDKLQMSTGTGVFGSFKKFDLLSVHGYAPSSYLACRDNAKANGAQVFIQDSISHAWIRNGGVLDLVSTAKERNPKLNNYTAWGDEIVKIEKELIYELFRDEDVHIISTVRLKEKQDLVDGKVVSLGDQQIFMPETKYEPDLVLHMLRAGNQDGTPPKAKVEKSRYAILTEGEVYEFTQPLLEQLRDYLAEGADPVVLREAQRVELVGAIKLYLDTNPSARGIWPTLKANEGHQDTNADDLPLKAARSLLGKLLED